MLAADKVRIYDPYFGEYYDPKARGKHHYVALSGVARNLPASACRSLSSTSPNLPSITCQVIFSQA